VTVTDADSGSGRTVRISGSVTAPAGTADGAGVVAATSAHTVSMIDARSGRTKWTASSASPAEVVSLSADQSSGLIAELDQRGTVTIRRLADGATVGTGAPPSAGPYTPAPAFVGFLDGGSRLAVGDVEGEVAILGLPDLSVLSRGPPGWGRGIRFRRPRTSWTDPASWVATAGRTAGRPQAPAEWETVIGSAAPGDLRCDRSR
jgi:hypothetical protein